MSKNVKKGTKCLINSSKLINGKKWEEHMLPHMLPTITCQQSAAKCLCFLVPSYISTPLVLQLTVCCQNKDYKIPHCIGPAMHC